jgi:hypothetical protein
MMETLVWLENSGLGTWVRESPSMFAYSGLISLHAFGLAFAAGVSAAIALRILGVAPGLPLAPMEKLFPIIWMAFWVNAASGALLLTASATMDLTNPVFFIKMAFVVLAIVAVWLLKHQVFRDPARLSTSPAPQRARLLAAATLVCWTGAIVAGRLVEYPVLFRQAPGAE